MAPTNLWLFVYGVMSRTNAFVCRAATAVNLLLLYHEHHPLVSSSTPLLSFCTLFPHFFLYLLFVLFSSSLLEEVFRAATAVLLPRTPSTSSSTSLLQALANYSFLWSKTRVGLRKISMILNILNLSFAFI